MLIRFNWWKPTSSRRKDLRIRAGFVESLERRVVLSAVMAGSMDTISVNDASVSLAAGTDSNETHHHAASDEIYLPPQHRMLATGSFLSPPDSGDPVQIAVKFLHQHAEELGLDANNSNSFTVTSQYTDESSGQTHMYLRQILDGLEVMNADISISLTSRGEVIHVTSSFVSGLPTKRDVTSQVIVNASQAFMELNADLKLGIHLDSNVVTIDPDSDETTTILSAAGTPIDDVAAKLVYVPTAEGLKLAWQLDVHDSGYSFWCDGFVDAGSGESLYVNDRIGHATYTVFALPTRSPIDGVRSIVVDPQDTTASPFGWHDTNGAAGADFWDTRGNNASVQEDVDHDNAGGFRPSGGAGLDFTFGLNTAIDPVNNQSASIANAFYVANLLHDIHYRYGFTEVAGNFQVNNYGRGGIGNDPVLIDIQDGDGSGDGFATLPDGTSPRMTLHRRSSPYRDTGFDTEIIVHEYGHGISERLTGGPANTSALSALQSKAMGEGWGDWWALMLTQESTDSKMGAYGIGNYAAGLPGNGPGIRQYPYSFDKSINPLTYNSFNGGAVNNESHKAGAIWASALWDMNWLLIDKHGFSSDFINGNAGNNLALQLVMDGLKLQGTNPSFLAGRDAVLAADRALTGGENQTEIWAAFARRGMGFSASDGGGASSVTVAEAFDLPGSISGTVFRDDNADGLKGNAESGLSEWQVFLDRNNNGVPDAATTTVINSTDTPKPIIDGPKTFSTRVVSGLPGTITDINVTVNLTHPAVGELYVTLISPGGTPVILANYLGGSGDNYSNTTFDDEAATYISSAAAPFSGSFKPYYNLSQLDGRNPNGTWTLRLDDSKAGNAGILLDWSMQITSGESDPVVVADAEGEYSFFGLGAGTHYVREVLQPGFTQSAPLNGLHNIVLASGQSVAGKNFGNRAAAKVSNISTFEDTLSKAIVIKPTVDQNITHFRISSIVGGSLFLNGAAIPVVNGDFLTIAQGLSGVKFLPHKNSNAAGHFRVELSQDGNNVMSGSSPAVCQISVIPVGDTPEVASVGTLANILSPPIVVARHTADGPEVTHFRISGITGGTLFQNNGISAVVNGMFITLAEAEAGLRFLPSVNSIVAGRFDVDSSENGTTVALQSGKATSTITVTPYQLPSLTIGDVTVSESQANATAWVTLSKPCSHPVSVTYATAPGTATVDYSSKSGLLTFAPGETTKPITVLLNGDLLDEFDESFYVVLSKPVSASIGDPYARITIQDNDAAPQLVINDVAVTEGNSGQTLAHFTVSISAASAKVITVRYGTANSTAVASADYVATSGTLNFPAGTTSQSLDVKVNADLLDEFTETFLVNLSGATYAVISDSRGIGAITDDDPLPSLSVNNVSIFEGNSGYTLATFTVTLSAASAKTVTVGYSTADNAGVSSGDYASKSGALSFASGVVSKTISVLVKGDVFKELDEFFSLNLSDALNATIADSRGLARIRNDD